MTATATVSAADGPRFWCHECAHHVGTCEADDGSGELCCAACSGNFVEQVEADDPPEQFLAEAVGTGDAPRGEGRDETEAAPRSTETLDEFISQIHEGFGPPPPANEASRMMTPRTPPSTTSSATLRDAHTNTTTTPPPRATNGAAAGDSPSPLTELLQQLVSGGGSANGGGTRTARIIRSNGTPVEFYVTSSGDGGSGDMGNGGLFGLLAGAMNAPFGSGGAGFVGNPGDYALGPNHLSQLINQLMQNDPNRHGAPPAAKEVVEKLPSHKVEQREVDANAECAVCKDLFAVDDDAKDLPCTHSFHPDCITPWLKMHNSCPVCRFELPTDDQDYEERRRHDDQHEATANLRW